MSRPKNQRIQITFTFINPNSDVEMHDLVRQVVVEKIVSVVKKEQP